MRTGSDRREDRRDVREDMRDAQHSGGWRDQREDVFGTRAKTSATARRTLGSTGGPLGPAREPLGSPPLDAAGLASGTSVAMCVVLLGNPEEQRHGRHPHQNPARRPARARAAPRGPDAIKLLKDDHKQVEAWFEDFEKTNSASKKQKLANQICLALKRPHPDRGRDFLSGLPRGGSGRRHDGRGRRRA